MWHRVARLDIWRAAEHAGCSDVRTPVPNLTKLRTQPAKRTDYRQRRPPQFGGLRGGQTPQGLLWRKHDTPHSFMNAKGRAGFGHFPFRPPTGVPTRRREQP